MNGPHRLVAQQGGIFAVFKRNYRRVVDEDLQEILSQAAIAAKEAKPSVLESGADLCQRWSQDNLHGTIERGIVSFKGSSVQCFNLVSTRVCGKELLHPVTVMTRIHGLFLLVFDSGRL